MYRLPLEAQFIQITLEISPVAIIVLCWVVKMSRQTVLLMLCGHCVAQSSCSLYKHVFMRLSFSLIDQGWLLEYLSEYLYLICHLSVSMLSNLGRGDKG